MAKNDKQTNNGLRKGNMKAGAPIGNTNAEVWSEEEAVSFMNQSLATLKIEKFDFIGELAQEMNQYRTLYNYLAEKYKSCKTLLNRIEQECEANCFQHGKKGKIVPSLAIMNLKSNHGWTDRTEQTIRQEQPLFEGE